MKLVAVDAPADAALLAGFAALPFAIFFALGTMAARSWERSLRRELLLEDQYPDSHLGI